MPKYLIYIKGTDEYESVEAEWAIAEEKGVRFFNSYEDGNEQEVGYFPMDNIIGYQEESTKFRRGRAMDSVKGRPASELADVPEFVSVLIYVPTQAPCSTVFEAYRVGDEMVAANYLAKGVYPITDVEAWMPMPDRIDCEPAPIEPYYGEERE